MREELRVIQEKKDAARQAEIIKAQQMQKELERQQRLNAARQREIAKAEEHRKEREQARRRIEESLKPAMDKV